MFGYQQQKPLPRSWIQPFMVGSVVGSIGIVVLVYLSVTLYPFAFAAVNLTTVASDPLSSTWQTQIDATTVDLTEDTKAMGYPDGRKIVRDGHGYLYVAYRKKYKLQHNTAYHIFVAKSTDNGNSWTVTNQGKPLEAVGDVNQRVPAIAVDSRNVIHVVWYGQDVPNGTPSGFGNQIKYVHSSNQGASWSPWRNIGYVEGYHKSGLWQEHPAIYIADNSHSKDSGNATPDPIYIVWEGYDARYRDASQVKFIQSRNGGADWSPWQNVAPSPVNHSRPTVVGTAQGKLYILAYGQTNRRPQIIYSQSADHGRTWSRWSPVAPTIVEQRHVSATVDHAGLLHIAWRQPVLSFWPWSQRNAQIYYATYNGNRWSNSRRVHPDAATAQTFPSISTDNSGNIWLAWSETAGSYAFPNDALQSGKIYYATKSVQGWNKPTMLVSTRTIPGATTLGATTSAQIVHDVYASLSRPARNSSGTPAGSIDIVWLENSQSLKEIQFAQLTTQTTASLDNRIDNVASQDSYRQGTTTSQAAGQNASRASLLTLHPLESSLMLSMALLPNSATFTSFLSQSFIMPSRALVTFAQTFWDRSLPREAQTLIVLIIMVACYVLFKFIVTRWMLLDTYTRSSRDNYTSL